MRVHGGLLAVHAHPDDETLSTGALLATWAAAGEPVTVVTCTRGERGEVIDSAAHPTGLAALEGDGLRLAAHREGELGRALDALGVTDHAFLDAADTGSGLRAAAQRSEDSGMVWVAPGIAGPDPAVPAGFARVPLDDAAGRLAVLVRHRRPRVVVTYDPGGGYGHPDHVRAHDVTVRALALAEDAAAPLDGLADGPVGAPWHVTELWAPVRPERDVRAARRLLAAAAPAHRTAVDDAGLALPDPDEPVLPPVVTWWSSGAAVDAGARSHLVEVPLAPVADRLAAALRAHATQVQAVALVAPRSDVLRSDVSCDPVVGRYALSNDVLAPLHATEQYAVVDRAAQRPAQAPRVR
ncbi:PIG-L family deacetylase [Luteimicrobium subarcticum]|uniref:N-acetyl-1-D-myo-inositol-2-amino-2-deoxy-alpha-D-glucopyranoside deacetylase n=1 Tax=Luteimicrobium subarcticum TaxID=620910 RepID=A0A2M8WUU5_9MICO|nr:PIG-L family deacetylase [Luteimicrobium subarcticum]PJI94636.1 N-acetyl-1-D-myo-inositol-2-amino-2-deoxy-alpha-D-glucopyranoside deacetylase [Luteimicrobium subarcticum]